MFPRLRKETQLPSFSLLSLLCVSVCVCVCVCMCVCMCV
jgi:hypothetical protein